jgi:hypothetical protein
MWQFNDKRIIRNQFHTRIYKLNFFKIIMKKNGWITLIIILLITIAIVLVSIFYPHPDTDEETVRCIGENSVLYVKQGCPACKIQKDLFGDNLQYLNIIDCSENPEACNNENIERIPTWEINGGKIIGVKSIKTLKELTGC